MTQICEIVSSNRGAIKLVVNGYIIAKNKNRDDLCYWCCEKQKMMQCSTMWLCTVSQILCRANGVGKVYWSHLNHILFHLNLVLNL